RSAELRAEREGAPRRARRVSRAQSRRRRRRRPRRPPRDRVLLEPRHARRVPGGRRRGARARRRAGAAPRPPRRPPPPPRRARVSRGPLPEVSPGRYFEMRLVSVSSQVRSKASSIFTRPTPLVNQNIAGRLIGISAGGTGSMTPRPRSSKPTLLVGTGPRATSCTVSVPLSWAWRSISILAGTWVVPPPPAAGRLGSALTPAPPAPA